MWRDTISFFFFFNDTATTEIYTLSLHDALPISETTPAFVQAKAIAQRVVDLLPEGSPVVTDAKRSEEHTSELQSPCNLVCRLLLEKKKKTTCRCRCCVERAPRSKAARRARRVRT